MTTIAVLLAARSSANAAADAVHDRGGIEPDRQRDTERHDDQIV
jgi:hypothetical protein